MEVQWPSEDLLASEKPNKNIGFPLVFQCFPYHCKSESWALLGGSWAPLGLYLEGLGRLLGSTWTLLGPTWGQLGRSWGQLGGNMVGLGTILGALGANLDALWATWTFQSFSWAALGGSGMCLGGPKELPWRSKAVSATQLGGPKPSAEPILEASSSLQCQFGDALLSLTAPLGGTRQLRNNPLMIRATRSKSSRPNPMDNQEDREKPLGNLVWHPRPC